MCRGPLFVTGVALICIFVLQVNTVSAQFDFTLSAQSDFLYGVYGQMGSNGFFGPYDVDTSPGGNYAPLNGWMGVRDVGNFVSGSNGAASTTSLQFNPKARVGWATVTARYGINPYNTATTQGTYVTISPGVLTTWSIDVDTPIARFGYGKSQFQRAFGLQFSANRTAEYLSAETSFPVPNLMGALVGSGILPRRMLNWFNPSYWPTYRRKKNDKGEYVGPEDEFYKREFEVFSAENGFSPPLKDPTATRQLPEEELPPGERGWRAKRRKATTEEDEQRFAWGHFGPGRITLGYGFYPWQGIQEQAVSWNIYDVNASRTANVLGYMRYDSWDLSAGIGGIYTSFHFGPESQGTPSNRQHQAPTDTAIDEGWAFLRYNNGWLFFSTELDWYQSVVRHQRSLSGDFLLQRLGATAQITEVVPDNVNGSGSFFAPDYVESWRYMAELGVMVGPAMVRLFYSHMPGPDRRHGIRIDRQPFIQDQQHTAMYLFNPYSMVLSYGYGGGVNSFGDLSDASIIGARIDYAMAANLTVSGSFCHATRVSHGYPIGFIMPDTASNNFGGVVYLGDYDYRRFNAAFEPFDTMIPSIPERDLGWEATMEILWKLLEPQDQGVGAWGVIFRAAFWKPGDWFKYACIDKSVLGWNNPLTAPNWGVNPNRDIDPVYAIQIGISTSL